MDEQTVVCSACDGTGEFGRTGRLGCGACRGTGELLVDRDPSAEAEAQLDRAEMRAALLEDR